MKKVTIYTTERCSFCVAAKKLLDSKGIPFEEVNLSNNLERLQALKKRSGLQTVPQIFFDEELIGGYQELVALEEKEGLLSKLHA